VHPRPFPTLRLILPALLLAGLLCAPAKAQSLYGPGGLFLFPTASFPPKGRITPGFLLLPQHDPDANVTRVWLSASLDYGLTDDIEIGGTFLKVTGWDRDPSFGGFVKYRLLKENAVRPAFAIGFNQLGFGDVNTRTGFLAARKEFSIGKRHLIVAHLGVQYIDEMDGFSHHEWEPYAGVEVGLTNRLTFIAEGRPRGNQEHGTPLALTLNYKVSKNWHLAATWANNGRSDQPRFGFGAGLSLGSR
jgi:hypothetical protein